jgi:Ubiquitin carboxyl-terminal hydrolase
MNFYHHDDDGDITLINDDNNSNNNDNVIAGSCTSIGNEDDNNHHHSCITPNKSATLAHQYINNNNSNSDVINPINACIQQQQQQQEKVSLNQQHYPSVKGLYNRTGTTCYINSALLILCYTFEPIISTFLSIITCSIHDNIKQKETQPQQSIIDVKQITIIKEFITVIQELLDISKFSIDDDDNHIQQHSIVVVDPIRFYQSIRRNDNNKCFCALSSIQYETFGDVISTFIHLLQFLLDIEKMTVDIALLSSLSSPSSSTLQNVYNTLLYSGQMYSVITGEWTCPGKNSTITKKKQLKLRILFNPLPLPIITQQHNDDVSIFPSLMDALHDMFMNEHMIDGYQWISMDDNNTGVNISDDNIPITTHISTKRRYHILSFPPIFMIQLQRFTINKNDNNQFIRPIENSTTPTMIIPETLHMSEFIQQQPSSPSSSTTTRTTSNDINLDHDEKMTYKLVGGIIHIHNYDNDTVNNNNNNEYDNVEEKHIGHYVTVLQQQKQWYLIDDDEVTCVSLEQVLLCFIRTSIVMDRWRLV